MSAQTNAADLKKENERRVTAKIPPEELRHKWVNTANAIMRGCAAVWSGQPGERFPEPTVSNKCVEATGVCGAVGPRGRSAAARPYLAATVPSQGLKQEETLERRGRGHGMLNISRPRRHPAW